MTSRGLWVLCNGPETPIQWKSEHATNQQTKPREKEHCKMVILDIFMPKPIKIIYI